MSSSFDLEHLNITAIAELTLNSTIRATLECERVRLENAKGNNDEKMELRVAAIVVILFGSSAATVLPLFLKVKLGKHKVAKRFQEAFKFTGAGVILSTAFFQ